MIDFFILFSLLFAQQDCLFEQLKIKLNRLDGVIVARDGIGDDVGVAIRVYDGRSGNARFSRIGDGLMRRVFSAVPGVQQHDQIRQPHLPFKEHFGGHKGLASPGSAVGEFAAFRRSPLDQMNQMRLSGREKHDPASVGQMGREIERLSEQQRGLIEVDNGRSEAGSEDERPHPRVNRSCGVTQMNSGVEKVFYGE